jgi:GNAT superfamily N-acetyltransferase
VTSSPAAGERLTIRPATPGDAATILRFIRELAHYEREPDAVVATEADLLRDGWGLAADGITPLSPAAPARFAALLAELDGAPAGFALYFASYSTWLGHHGIRLEDLYVTPALRVRGIGKALLARLARIALDEGCPRLEWDVLDWNEPAIAVYRRIGATLQSDWRIMRLAGDALHTLAASDAFSS